MSVETSRHPSYVMFVGDEPFLVARTDKGAPLFRPTKVPTQEGDPTTPRRKRYQDWSRGLGDSRGVFRGSVEYAENAYLGAPGRILPGPKVTAIDVNHDGDVTALVEVDAPASRILAGGGTKISAITPATDAITLERTVAGGAVLSMQRFDTQVAIALGDSQDYEVRSAAGAYAANSFSKKARCFGLVGNPDTAVTGAILAKGKGATRAVCSSSNITTVDGWSTELQIGKAEGNVNRIFSHNRWEYVLKDEGLYSFDEATSEEANLLTDLEAFPSSSNAFVFKWYDHIYVCTIAGLYRYIQQGASRTAGIEEIAFNESELANVYPTAGVAFGHAIVVAWTDGTSTWITQGRRAMEGDASSGSPVTFLSVVEKFTGLCKAMIVSAKIGTPHVYYGARESGGHYSVHRFGLSRDGRPSTFRDSGTVTVWMPPSDLDAPMTLKTFRGVEVVGRNASAGRTIQMKAKVDGGSANNVGSAITAFSSGYATAFWTLASNDEGRVLQLGLTMTCDSTATVPEVRDLVLNYEERPLMVDGFVVGLAFRDFFDAGDVTSRLSAEEQRATIEDAIAGRPLTIVDPTGRSFTGRIAHAAGEIAQQYRGEQAQVDMLVTVRELEYS